MKSGVVTVIGALQEGLNLHVTHILVFHRAVPCERRLVAAVCSL